MGFRKWRWDPGSRGGIQEVEVGTEEAEVQIDEEVMGIEKEDAGIKEDCSLNSLQAKLFDLCL